MVPCCLYLLSVSVIFSDARHIFTLCMCKLYLVPLTLCLQVSSADNIFKQFETSSVPTNPNCIPERFFFLKKLILKEKKNTPADDNTACKNPQHAELKWLSGHHKLEM